ncbi:hypothetical protein IscW_ISCW001888, partial [Ixodes scapularis]
KFKQDQNKKKDKKEFSSAAMKALYKVKTNAETKTFVDASNSRTTTKQTRKQLYQVIKKQWT